MKKARKQLSFAALLLVAMLFPSLAMGQIKDRNYYVAQNDNTNHPDAPNKVLRMSTWYNEQGSLGDQYSNFEPDGAVYLGYGTGNSFRCSDGAKFTILAMLETPITTEDDVMIHGYVSVGSPTNFESLYNSTSTFVGRALSGNGQENQYYPTWFYEAENDTAKWSITIPKYIVTARYSPQYPNKTFQVVGLDKGALQQTEAKIILPSSITFIEDCALRYTGGETYRRKLAFYEGAGYTATLSNDYNDTYYLTGAINTIYDDPASTEWQELNNIEYLGNSACEQSYYNSIEDVIAPGKLCYMGEKCFWDARNITSITMNATDYTNFDWKFRTKVFSTDQDIFTNETDEDGKKHCNKLLKTVEIIADQPVEIHDGAFQYNGNITSVILPNGLDSLGANAFSSCIRLENLQFSPTSTLTDIGAHAFNLCTSLRFCKLPESVTTIQAHAFSSCAFEGRFDIPTHVKNIGNFAYHLNPITYIPIPEITGEPLRIGDNAFQSPKDLTVEFFATTPSNIKLINDDGNSATKPWELVPTYDENWNQINRLRLIVPIGSVENYMKNGFLDSQYEHGDFRVKFDLSKSYEKPPYGQPKDAQVSADDILVNGKFYDQAPWYIASSAWANDIYTFKPYNGGTVDGWTVEQSINQNGETKELWTATTKYFGEYERIWYSGDIYEDIPICLRDGNGNIISEENNNEEKHIIHPRTAHQYHHNKNGDNIAKISTLKVNDGIVPPNVGILLAYPEPNIYLVPAAEDWKKWAEPKAEKRPIIGFDAGWTDGFGYYFEPQYDGDAMEYADSVAMKEFEGKLWINYEQLNSYVQLHERQTDGTFKEPFWISYEETYLNWEEYYATITTNTGEELDKYESIGEATPIYRIPENVDWSSTDNLSYKFRNSLTPVGFILRSEVANIVDPTTFAINLDTPVSTEIDGKSYSINELSPIGSTWMNFNFIEGTVTQTNQYNHERSYTENHANRGNALVPCVEPTYVYPYWRAISEEIESTDEAAIIAKYNELEAINPDSVDIAINFYENNNTWVVDSIPVVGKLAVELEPNGNYGKGFISFGLSNGYFVQTKNPGNTKANRSYFRIYTDQLHGKPTTTLAKAVIVDISEIDKYNEVTEIVAPETLTEKNVWYGIDGRKLNGKPSQKGFYINNGKKVIVN